jgi:nucleoside-diphosphate-sugar epimerase
VLIVGAGDLGLALAARFLALDAEVTTLNRSGRGTDGARSWRGDLADPATLAGLPMAETVVFTTSPPGRDAAAYRLAYIDGPARILAALPSTPDRLVLTSTTGVYGVDDGSWVDETSPTEPTRATAAAVVEGERRLADTQTTTVAVRPAGIYGPGRGALQERIRAGEEPVASDDTPRWTNRVHRDDVVAALFVAATHPEPPPALIAVDDEPAPRDEVIRYLAARLGAPTPTTIDVPTPTGKRCRNAALRALGWVPRYPNYREGYDALLG